MKRLGEIEIESSDSLVVGCFKEFAEFKNYSELFLNFAEAANNQELVEVDRLEKIIQSFEFKVTAVNGSDERFIHDLQIVEGQISFRWGLPFKIT